MKNFVLKIPVNIENMTRGRKILTVDRSLVSEYFTMTEKDIHRLAKFFSIPRKLNPVKNEALMDRLSLAVRYRELIEQGYFQDQTDLTRHLGVSRAWVTNVMNELKQVRNN